MGGPWDRPNSGSEPGKARWLAKGNPEEMPRISDSNYHEGMAISLSPPVCLSTCTLFPPNKCFTWFTTFHFFVEIHFLQSHMGQGLVTCCWSLVVWWLEFSSLTAPAWLQSLAGNWKPAANHCRRRPPVISINWIASHSKEWWVTALRVGMWQKTGVFHGRSNILGHLTPIDYFCYHRTVEQNGDQTVFRAFS